MPLVLWGTHPDKKTDPDNAMRISVVTVCYNAAPTLADAVESVLGQLPDRQAPFDLEYIVVDGGSTDGTLDLLEPTATASPRSYPSPTAVSTMP